MAATKVRSSKVKLESGKFVNRVVKNIVDNFDGTFSGSIQMNGAEITVTRRKHSRSWAVVV